MSKSRLVSGRVFALTGSLLSADRRQFLNLEQAEPNLGLPTTGSLVGSFTDGVRYFISGSSTLSVVTYNDTFDRWEAVPYLNWNQLNPVIGEVYLTGSVNLSGSFFLNDEDILQQIQNSGIFKQTGSFWATTNDLQVTGSLQIKLTGSNTFEIKNEQEKGIQVNEEGVLILHPFTDTPTPISGGFIFSASNEFFIGL